MDSAIPDDGGRQAAQPTLSSRGGAGLEGTVASSSEASQTATDGSVLRVALSEPASAHPSGGASVGTTPSPQSPQENGTRAMPQSAGAEPPGVGQPGVAPSASGSHSSGLLRLSRRQWAQSALELMGLLEPSVEWVASQLRPDPLTRFDNTGDLLTVDRDLHRSAAKVAAVLWSRIQGDEQRVYATAGLATALQGSPQRRAAHFIDGLAARLPWLIPKGPLKGRLIELFLEGEEESGVASAEQLNGEGWVLRALLLSPNFWYRSELGASDGSLGADAGGDATAVQHLELAPTEIALKLSYGLTGRPPSKALWQGATDGDLQDSHQRGAIAAQLLDTEDALVQSVRFHSAWWGTAAYDGIQRDPTRFPDFQLGTGEQFRHSTTRLFEHAFLQDWSVEQLLTTQVAFVTREMGGFYGLSPRPSAGSDLLRAELPQERAGLLTRLGFLADGAHPRERRPIRRGALVADRLLCLQLAQPPGLSLRSKSTPADAPLREQLEQRTGAGTCGGSCHGDWLNPLGFAFERFDALGRYAADRDGETVDASAALFLDGSRHRFDGAVELSALLARSTSVRRCYGRHWLSYISGRQLTTQDGEHLEDALSGAAGQGLRELLIGLVEDHRFARRTLEGPSGEGHDG